METVLLGLLIVAFVVLFGMNIPFTFVQFQPLPNYGHTFAEPFGSNTYTDNDETIQCGVDMPDCPEDKKCMNGYCKSTTMPPLPKNTGLPVYP
jgi:hypothetical protein